MVLLILKMQQIKLWDYLGRKTYESDGATRKGVYKKVLEATGSQAEAAFQASEIINFSRRGGHPIIYHYNSYSILKRKNTRTRCTVQKYDW